MKISAELREQIKQRKYVPLGGDESKPSVPENWEGLDSAAGDDETAELVIMERDRYDRIQSAAGQLEGLARVMFCALPSDVAHGLAVEFERVCDYLALLLPDSPDADSPDGLAVPEMLAIKLAKGLKIPAPNDGEAIPIYGSKVAKFDDPNFEILDLPECCQPGGKPCGKEYCRCMQ